MGKKIPFFQALPSIKTIDTIYAPQNRYGYKINVNHPDIKPLYDKYKKYIGEKILSDAQRHHFESLVFKTIERNRRK